MLTIDTSTHGTTVYAHRCRVNGNVPPDVMKAFRTRLSYIDEDTASMRAVYSAITKHTDCGGSVNHYTCNKCKQSVTDDQITRSITFSRGMLSAVCDIITAHKVPYQVNVQTSPPDPVPVTGANFPPLRPYQLECVANLDYHSHCLIDSPPRSGKTLMLAMDWARRGKPKGLFVCDTIVLAEQSQRAFEEYFPDTDIGIIGDGRCEIGQMTVMVLQAGYSALQRVGTVKPLPAKQSKLLARQGLLDTSAAESPKHKEICDLIAECTYIIRDEAHHSVGVMYKALSRHAKNALIRRHASGTPWHAGSNGLALEEQTGPIVWSVGYEHLFEHGYLVRPTVFMVVPAEKTFAGKVWATIYKEYVVESDERNGVIEEFNMLMADAGKSVANIVSQIKHGDILQELMPDADALYGSVRCFDRAHRAAVLEKLHSKEILQVISTVMGEGVDVPSLDAVVNAAGQQAAIAVLQRMRCMTPSDGKTMAFVLDFLDQAKYVRKHGNKRKELYENFGFKVVVCFPSELREAVAAISRGEHWHSDGATRKALARSNKRRKETAGENAAKLPNFV